MKANQLVITKKDIDLDIEEITLLSFDEYTAAHDFIPARDHYWWLRTLYFKDSSMREPRRCLYSGCVSSDWISGLFNSLVTNENAGVRPALRIRNLRSFNLNPGDKLELSWRTWTIIADDMVLCDGIVGKTPFRKDRHAKDANVYEASDVKKWVENWAKENGIVVNAAPISPKGKRKSKGYDVFEFNNMGIFEIQKLAESKRFEDDEEAVEQAIKDGVKIIPVDELPETFGRRYLGWIDTPENREKIKEYAKKYPNDELV